MIDQAQQSAANGQLKEALTHLQASLPTAGNGRDRFRLRKAQYELLDRFAPSPQLQVALAGLLRQAQEQRLAHWEPALVQPLLESALGYPSSDATTAWPSNWPRWICRPTGIYVAQNLAKATKSHYIKDPSKLEKFWGHEWLLGLVTRSKKMASDGSVAPKERVNIVYTSDTGGAQEQVELPLKQLVLGDFTLREDDTPLEDIKPIRVDKDNFSDVLKGQNLSLQLNVANRLSENAAEDEQLPITMRFQSLRDFEPDAIVNQVPELQKLIALRDALKALKGPMGNLPEFRKQLQSLMNDEGARERLLAELGVKDKE